jgi:hypothetical protein
MTTFPLSRARERVGARADSARRAAALALAFGPPLTTPAGAER